MNNLKRILSLALATVMVIGMMVVGASATEFTDAEKINPDYANAVKTMNALGIINGFEDDTFRPEDTLTRAQMAMMLATIFRNGRTDFKFAVKENPSFKDVKSTDWYAGAIEYATNMKIIGGRGNGIFDPASTVTGVEAARMILNAMGYAQGEGDWQLNTVLQAEDAGLYKGLAEEDQLAGKLTREAAAQMLCNALDADMAGNATQEVPVAIKELKWIISPVEGKLTDDELAAIDDMNKLGFDSYNDAKVWAADNTTSKTLGTDYSIIQGEVVVGTGTKTEPESLGHKYLSISKSTDYVKNVTKARNGYTLTLANGDTFTKLDTDYSDLMGQKVRVLYKGTDKTAVYGVVALGTVLYEGGYGDLRFAAKTITIAGKNYASDNGTVAPTYNFNKFNVATPAKETAVKVIDNDGDGAIDLIVATPFTVEEVRNLSATRITLTSGSKLIGEEIVALEGIKVGDYVKVVAPDYTVSGMIELAATESVTGDFTSTRNTTDVNVGGTWYKKADNVIASLSTLPTIGSKDVTLILANGYYVGVKAASTASKDMLIVTQKATAVNDTTFTTTLECQVLFLKDGTTATVKVEKVGTAIVATSNVHEDSLYNYTVKNGLYTLTAASTTSTGYQAALGNSKNLNKTAIDGKIIADDAVVLVKYGTGSAATTKYALLDGKTVKSWGYNTTPAISTVANVAGFVDTVANVPYVKVAVLATTATRLPNSVGTEALYGWLMSAPVRYTESTADGPETYYSYTLWNGAETLTVKDRNNPTTDIVTYVDNKDGTISSADAGAAPMAVTGLALSDNIVFMAETGTTGSAYNLTKDTKYIYIDTKNWEGADSGSITEAIGAGADSNGDPVAYAHNVYVAHTGYDVDLIVIDINNDLGTKTEQMGADMVGTLPAFPATGTTLNLTKAQMTGTALTGGTLLGDNGAPLCNITAERAKLGGSTQVKVFKISMKDLMEKAGIAEDASVSIVRTSGSADTETVTFKAANTLWLAVGEKTTKVEFKVGGTVKYTINTADWTV